MYNAGQIGALRIHPTNPNIVWVAAYGDIFKPNAERGVFKTTDGGKTWKKTLFVSDSTGAMDVEVQPGNPNVVYAWMSRIERKPWTIISGSREGGFYKSTDGGDTWTKGGAGLPSELIGKANLAVTAANPQRIYALIEALPGGGLYRSENAGQSWALMNSQASLLQRPFYYTTLAADPTNADVVYAGAESFFKSVDGGKTMTAMRTPHGDNHDMWISPKDGNTMIQSNDGGANVSFDGGRTWSTQDNQPTAEFYGIATDDAFPYKLYAAQQDNSTYVFSSITDPFDVANFRTGPGCETGPILPHPKEKNIIYGSCKGQFTVMNTETAQSKNYWIGAQSLYGNAGGELIYRFQRVSPMALSPHDPNVLYYGSQYLHRTRDKGVTWEKNLTRPHRLPAVLPGRERRADHARRHRRRVLQHALRDHRVAARTWRDLDGLERRAVSRVERQWPHVEERDAQGSPDRRTRRLDRCIATPKGLGVLCRVSLSPWRLCAVHLPHRQLRRDVDAPDRRQERHSG